MANKQARKYRGPRTPMWCRVVCGVAAGLLLIAVAAMAIGGILA